MQWQSFVQTMCGGVCRLCWLTTGKTLAWLDDTVSNMACQRIPAVLVGVKNEILDIAPLRPRWQTSLGAMAV